MRKVHRDRGRATTVHEGWREVATKEASAQPRIEHIKGGEGRTDTTGANEQTVAGTAGMGGAVTMTIQGRDDGVSLVVGVGVDRRRS